MAARDRDIRLTEASTLQEAIEALEPLDPVKRQGFTHDRLIEAIDDICEKRKDSQGNPPFTLDQMFILKDISHQIVYLSIPLNRRKRGFIVDLKSNWNESKPFDKIKVAVAVLVFLYGVVVGSYNLAVSGWNATHIPSTNTGAGGAAPTR